MTKEEPQSLFKKSDAKSPSNKAAESGVDDEVVEELDELSHVSDNGLESL